ncbi:uncharacterized protein AB675_2163 [Cyphellophora attinorum]|uniref:NmrA-like domain-containing protein n=1 Tax=Cyphellophora attinorum TaxID=1664694 RepID=A0A0N1HDK6_9EURO|nr:uncharacterized protein AB675_2163 [Phialophora attinorum]KPI43092.1 hypothetical protein AB675_2163 [Phialophora attinorum]
MERKIIIAVDYGTTYSGVAWAQTARPDVKYTITQWPNSTDTFEGKTQDKVPTELSYDKNGHVKWGFQISQDEFRFQWFKLGLDESQTGGVSHLTVEYPDPRALSPSSTHSATSLTTDFLACIRKHVSDVLKVKLGQDVLEITPLGFIITVPAIYDDAAKARTAACARQAGMGDDVRIITEPEAAIIYTLDAMDPHNLKSGIPSSCALHPQVKVREAAPGSGSACGSTFLNRIFAKDLDVMFDDNEQWDDDIKQQAMDEFEVSKRDFTGSENKMMLAVGGLADDTLTGVRRGRLNIPASKVKTAYFQPVVSTIITLVQSQIKQTKAPKAVLLVGGFGRNPYLRHCLQSVVGTEIKVLQPGRAWTAVVEGALIWGLNDHSPTDSRINIASRKARKAYGIKVEIPFSSFEHEDADKYWDFYHGTFFITAMRWFVRKGDDIDQDEPLISHYVTKRRVVDGPPIVHSTRLYSFNSITDASPPDFPETSMKQLVSLVADLSTIPVSEIPQKLGSDGNMWYVLEFDIRTKFFSAHTEYSLWHDGEQYGKVDAERRKDPAHHALSKILVLGATGTQGLAVVRAIISESFTSSVHALTRDTKSDKAQALAALASQVQLFEGTFDDISALETAVKGCSAVFINTSPSLADPAAETRHVRTILSVFAASKSIKRVIYSSTAGTTDPNAPGAFGSHPDMTPGNLPYHVTLDKYTNEQAVMRAAKENAWQSTILRPAVFLTNLLEPMSSFKFPELKKQKKIRGMLPPETEFDWIDPRDIGEVAAKVLLGRSPDSSDVQFVELAGERATLQTVVSAMEKAAGVKIEIEQVDREQAKMSEDPVTKAMAGIWLVDHHARVGDWIGARRFGFVPGSVADFFEGSKEAVRKAIGA